MDTDFTNDSDGLQSIVWKQAVNGKTAFFTEEVYRQLAGPEPSLEEKVKQMMDGLGFPSPSKLSKSTKHSGNGNKLGSGDPDDPVRGGRPTLVTMAKKKEAATVPQRFPVQKVAPVKTLSSGLQETSVVSEMSTSSSTTVPLTSTVPGFPAVLGTSAERQKEAEEAKSSEQMGQEPDAAQTRISKNTATSETCLSHIPQLQNEYVNSTEGPVHHMNKGGGTMDVAGPSQQPGQRGKGPQKGKRAPPEARKSSLSHEQHIRYLDLFKKCMQKFFSGFQSPPSDRELQELKEFETLQMQVAKEQEECQAYLKQLSLHSPYLYNQMPPHMTKYTQAEEESSWKRAENYSRYYIPHSHLPLTAAAVQPSTDPPALTLVQTVLEMGTKCRLVLPDLNPNNSNPNAKLKRTVSTDPQKVTARFPLARPVSHDRWNHEPASKDTNMERLVGKFPCHIATTSSVLQQLLDNHAPDFCAAWDIPVVVKEYGQGSASRKVVFLDKPLLPQGMSQSQRKTRYLQKALRTFVCQPHNERKSHGTREQEAARVVEHDAGHSRSLHNVSEDEDPFGATVSMDDLETFGSDRLFAQTKKSVPTLKPDGGGTSNVVDHGSKASLISGAQSMLSTVKVEEEIRDPRIGQIEKRANENGGVNELDDVESKLETSAENTAIETTKDPSLNEASSASQLTVSQNSAPAKRCLRSSGLSDGDTLSESDDDALVIALPTSPAVGAGKPSQTPHRSISIRSRDSRTSIFDEVQGASAYPPPSGSAPNSQISATPVTRRMTRSASQKLMVSGSETLSNTDTSVDDANSVSGADVRTSPQKDSTVSTTSSCAASQRTTRQAAKRKLPDHESAPQENSISSPTSETQSSIKKAKDCVMEESVSEKMEECASVPQTRSSPARHARGNEKSNGNKPSAGTATSTPLDSILKEMMPSGDSAVLKFQEDPSQYHGPGVTGDQVGYHLWDLSGISILIRCSGHAFIRDMRQQQKAVYVRAKPERHVHHGLEQSTLSECVRAWLGCYLRPNSYLLRARVNMQNYELVHLEELQLNQILQPTLSFSPQWAFLVLKNIFTKLMQLPGGSYLLSHGAGTDHVQLKAATSNKRGCYDLRCHYMSLVMKETDKTVPWVPVDPTLMLPHHWRLGLIPATFQPPDFDQKKKKQQHFIPQKKKNRNKKKKQN